MRKSILARLAPLLVLALLTTAPAKADCCDSFLSCAAAVATEGISCAIENLVATVQGMIHMVEGLSSGMFSMATDVGKAAQDSIKAASDDLRQLKADAESEIQGAVTDGQTLAAQVRAPRFGMVAPAPVAPRPALVAPAPAAGGNSSQASRSASAVVRQPTATPTVAQKFVPPASRDEMKDAMNRAEAYLLATQVTLEHDSAAPVQVATDGALGFVTRVLDAAVQRAVTKLVSPLSNLKDKLLALIRNPTRLFDPATMVDDQVTAVQSQMGDVMAVLADDATRDATASLNAARPALERLQQGAASLRNIANAMATVVRVGNEDVLKDLNDLLPPPPAPNPAPGPPAVARPVLSMSSVNLEVQNKRALITPALAKTQNAKAHAAQVSSKVQQDLSSTWSTVKGLQATKAAVSPETRAKVSGDFDALFRGATPKEVDAKKAELVAEARKRFKGDPGTLRKVEDFINRQGLQKVQ